MVPCGDARVRQANELTCRRAFIGLHFDLHAHRPVAGCERDSKANLGEALDVGGDALAETVGNSHVPVAVGIAGLAARRAVRNDDQLHCEVRVTNLAAYVPRSLGAIAPSWQTVEGSLVFADLSGFTALSERLARRGPIGAELMTDVLNDRFSRLLDTVEVLRGDLLSFGGDALLVLFDGERHADRALTAASQMRRRLRGGAAGLPPVTLRMSVGVCSGEVHLFTVGTEHPMLVSAGSTVSSALRLETAASAGEILAMVAPSALAAVGASTAAAPNGDLIGRLRRPAVASVPPVFGRRPRGDVLDPALRAAVLGGARAEHRHATVGFVKFSGTDALCTEPAVALEVLHELVSAAQRAADAHDVCLMSTDVDVDGGKLMFDAGGLVSCKGVPPRYSG